MTQFFIWLFILLFFTGTTIVLGYKTKEAWDKWHWEKSPHTAKEMSQPPINNNAASQRGSLTDEPSKMEIVKLKIKRAFEDYEQVVETIKKDFPKESEALANKYNVNGVLSSGMHIKAQMELSTSVKEKLEQALTKLNRDIEDVLIENFDKTALGSLGDDFTEEMQRLNKAKSALHEICKALADSAKSWEVKALGEVRLTKDFNL